MKERVKILIAEPEDFGKDTIEQLKEYAEVDVKGVSSEELKDSFKKYDVIWFRLGHRIDSSVIEDNVKCKIVATPVTGIDHIDEKLCAAKGIEIISLKGEKEFLKEIRATAELTIGLTLALLRRIVPAAQSVKRGIWNRDAFRGNELYGKTAGIIGIGRLGKITAGYFKAFGMKVIGYDINNEYDTELNEKASSIGELIKQSDVVSVHVNYNDVTKNLIGEKEFSLFKRDAVLINTSRGGVIDEAALIEALEQGQLKGAALDVVKDEFSFSKDNALVKYAQENDNLLIVPHIGGNTFESFEKTEKFIAEKIIARIKELAV